MSSASEHPLIPATIADIAVWGPTAEQVDLHVERPDVVQVVSLVRDADGEEDAAISRWAGLGKRYPVVGIVFSLFLLAFAGIPLTSGFVGKFAVFKAAGEGGAIPLVIVGVIASAIAAYFYVRVIVLMFFTERPEDAPVVVVPSALTTSVVAVTAAVTFALGALPQPVLDMVNSAGRFL